MSSSSPPVACTNYHPVQKPIKTCSNLSITASRTFSSKEPTIPLGCVNENACGVEKKLDFDRVAKLTPRKNKLYYMIQTRESTLCNLRKKYRAKKLKEVWQ